MSQTITWNPLPDDGKDALIRQRSEYHILKEVMFQNAKLGCFGLYFDQEALNIILRAVDFETYSDVIRALKQKAEETKLKGENNGN